MEKSRKYKKTIAFCTLIGVVAFGAYAGILFTENIVILAGITAFVGFFLTPVLPLGLEFACEITFPVGEAVSGGALIGVSQVLGAGLVKFLFAIQS